jgi:hypothetical protein
VGIQTRHLVLQKLKRLPDKLPPVRPADRQGLAAGDELDHSAAEVLDNEAVFPSALADAIQAHMQQELVEARFI